MRVTITPRHRRAFRRAGIEFPAEGRALDLAALPADVRAAIEAESWLVITPAAAPAPADAAESAAAPAETSAAAPARSRRRAAPEPEVGVQMKKTDLI